MNKREKEDAVTKARERVLVLAVLWANEAAEREVLSSRSHRLMRAVQKLQSVLE